MAENSFITILIAEDNDVSRDLMAGILRQQGFKVIGAIDGESAIKVVEEHGIDLAFVDINMIPTGGFAFVKYLIANGLKIPVVIVTADQSSDVLMEANSLGVKQVIQKPIDPKRLTQTAHRILKAHGLNPNPIAVAEHQSNFSLEELMKRTIELAAKNARTKMGGPFGAIITDAQGKVISEGVNGAGSRADPTAHAEVMAIRLAADKLGRSDLSDCVLYCSSQPTMIGQALIKSVGIKTVYYGLSHEDIGQVKAHSAPVEPEYKQIAQAAALAMFKGAQGS